MDTEINNHQQREGNNNEKRKDTVGERDGSVSIADGSVSIADINDERSQPHGTSVTSMSSLEKRKSRGTTSRRQTRVKEVEYTLKVEEEEEPDFLKEMKELDDKMTAQDLLIHGTYSDSDPRMNAKFTDRKELTPPPRLPLGGVQVAEHKYWVPKTINPLEIELRKYQMKELKDAFDFLEDAKTGMVSVNDVATIVRACGFEPKHGEVYDILDKVNPYYPGSLSFEEFALVFKYKLDQKDPIEEVERAFKLMDLSKTGKVTFEDLKRVSKLVDYEVNDEELQQMIDEAFPSPDGDATINGFVHLMSRKHYFDEPNVTRSHKKPAAPEKKKFKKSYRTSFNFNPTTLPGQN